jgi:hypothetical protein
MNTTGETMMMPSVKDAALCMLNDSGNKTGTILLSNNKAAYYIPNLSAAIKKNLIF